MARHTGPSNAVKMSAREKEKRVLELRVAGKSFEDIATEVGYHDRQGAYTAFARAIKNIPKEAADEAREVSEQRFTRLLDAVWARAMRGDTYAIETILKIEAQRARLFGLNKEAEQGPPTAVVKAYIGIPVDDL